MWVVVFAVVAVVAGAVVLAILRRPKGNDMSSVRRYHSALGTIEHLSDRVGRAPVRVVGGSEGTDERGAATGSEGAQRSAGGDGIEKGSGDDTGSRTGADSTGHVRTVPGTNGWYPQAPVRGNGELPDPGTALVFDDSPPGDRTRREGSTQGGPRPRADRAQRHALESMNRRPRRGTTAMVVIAVVVVFGTLAYLGSRRSEPKDHAHPRVHSSSVSATSTSTSRTTGPSSTSSSGPGASHRGGRARAQGKKTKPTATTVPTQIIAASTTPGGATYPVSANSYVVTVTASGPCWVLARSAPSGSTLWTGTLHAGAAQSIQATGAITVELGAPSASLRVQNVPVALPTPLHTPFVATFQPVTTGGPAPGSVTTAPNPSTTAATG